jgi:tRNA-dihydrouridine synthase
VSVKTRLGYDEVITKEWFTFLLKQNLDLITVHGRVSKDGYSDPIKWDEIARVVELRDEISPTTVILGNGDIEDLDMADEYIDRYGVDGVMIGRAVMQNPWVFARRDEISKKERLDTLKYHLELFKATWEGVKPFYSQNKYVKMYLSNFEGAQELRMKFMKCDTVDEALQLFSQS